MKVLVAIDHSEYSANAVDSLLTRPWPPDTEFRVINVVEPAWYLAYGLVYDPAAVNALVAAEEEIKKSAMVMVEKQAKKIRDTLRDLKVEGRVLEGNPAATIIDDADTWNADLVVVGSHGRRGWQKLLGSTAQKIAIDAPCSVEILTSSPP
jgi:nucleotide-binding universal stress UspA family protein